MSISARNWAWDQQMRQLAPNERPKAGYKIGTRLSNGEKLVLLYLAECENHAEGYAWPSQAAIAERCCLTERSVRTHLGTLECVGLIRTEKRGRSLRYVLNVEDEYRRKERKSESNVSKISEVAA